jgi:capsular exopolysaccharide synthesis family protein
VDDHARADGADGEINLLDLAKVLLRRWRVVAAIALVTAVVVFVAGVRKPPGYYASARLTVDIGEQAVDFQRNPTYGYVEWGYLNTERDRLLSGTVLSAALEDGDLIDHEAFVDDPDPISSLRGMLGVDLSKDSWTITVSVTSYSSAFSLRVVRAVVDAYLESQSRAASARARDAVAFLAEQIAERRRQLEIARTAELTFRQEHDILSADPDYNRHAQRLRKLGDQWANLERSLASAQAVMDQVLSARAVLGADDEDQLSARTQALLRIEPINAHPVVHEQQKLLFALRDRQVHLAQKYGPRHPRMIEVSEGIAAKVGHLDDAVALAAAAVENGFRQIQLEAEELRGQLDEVQEDLAGYREALNGLRVREQAVKTQEEVLEDLLKRQAEQEVASRLEGGLVQVIDQPSASLDPVRRSAKLIAAIAVVLGLGLGCAVAFVLDLLDRRVRDPDQVARLLGAPVLGAVPYQREIDREASGGAEEGTSVIVDEAFRQLRAALRFVNGDGSWPQVLLLTSVEAGDGKTTTVWHLGQSLAAAGAKVLIVEADLHRPKLGDFIGESTGPGFSYLLVGERDLAYVQSDHPGLYVLPAGDLPPNPAELLHSTEVPAAIARWRETYDFILIDTPPLGMIADALVVAEHVDGVLVVVRENYSNAPGLRALRAKLGPYAGRLLGSIYNGFNARASSYYAYGDGYYASAKASTNWQGGSLAESGWRRAGDSATNVNDEREA